MQFFMHQLLKGGGEFTNVLLRFTNDLHMAWIRISHRTSISKSNMIRSGSEGTPRSLVGVSLIPRSYHTHRSSRSLSNVFHTLTYAIAYEPSVYRRQVSRLRHPITYHHNWSATPTEFRMDSVPIPRRKQRPTLAIPRRKSRPKFVLDSNHTQTERKRWKSQRPQTSQTSSFYPRISKHKLKSYARPRARRTCSYHDRSSDGAQLSGGSDRAHSRESRSSRLKGDVDFGLGNYPVKPVNSSEEPGSDAQCSIDGDGLDFDGDGDFSDADGVDGVDGLDVDVGGLDVGGGGIGGIGGFDGCALQ
jgi:hypothetical protein